MRPATVGQITRLPSKRCSPSRCRYYGGHRHRQTVPQFGAQASPTGWSVSRRSLDHGERGAATLVGDRWKAAGSVLRASQPLYGQGGQFRARCRDGDISSMNNTNAEAPTNASTIVLMTAPTVPRLPVTPFPGCSEPSRERILRGGPPEWGRISTVRPWVRQEVDCPLFWSSTAGHSCVGIVR